MPQRNVPRSAAVYGIDIGKNIFHVVGLGSDGVPVQKVRFRRDTLLQFFERSAGDRGNGILRWLSMDCQEDKGSGT